MSYDKFTLYVHSFVARALEAQAEKEHIDVDDLINRVLTQECFGRRSARWDWSGAVPVIPPDPPLPLRAEPTKKVYFMRRGDVGSIKIGVSLRPDLRRIEIANSSDEKIHLLLAIDETDEINEKALHKRFAAYRKSGEWFEPCAELLDLIERLKAAA